MVFHNSTSQFQRCQSLATSRLALGRWGDSQAHWRQWSHILKNKWLVSELFNWNFSTTFRMCPLLCGRQIIHREWSRCRYKSRLHLTGYLTTAYRVPKRNGEAERLVYRLYPSFRAIWWHFVRSPTETEAQSTVLPSDLRFPRSWRCILWSSVKKPCMKNVYIVKTQLNIGCVFTV